MGNFANNLLIKIIVWITAAIIVALNMKLLYDFLSGWLIASLWLWLVLGPIVLLLLGTLIFITIRPLFHKGTVWTSMDIDGIDKVAPNIKPVIIRNIGIALEHSEGDAKIISAALMLAKSNNARLTLIHVVDTPGVTVYGSESQSLHSSGDQLYLQHLAAEIAERDFIVGTDLRFGRPVEQLVRSVKENGFDLLVLGSHGHRHIWPDRRFRPPRNRNPRLRRQNTRTGIGTAT